MALSRILLTGAAGNLGRALRQRRAGRQDLLRLSDAQEMEPAGKGEEVIVCDLADADGVAALCQGVEAVLHFGGQSGEAPWPRILQSNITGLVNLYEGARKAGVDRVIFASSNHAIGFYPRSERLDHSSPAKPDSRYGVSKAFGEDLAHYYAMKHGIRSLCLRIGSCFPKPVDARQLATWLSFDDLDRLVTVGLTADYVYEVAYGVSANTRSWWDNTNVMRLGYAPQDNAEDYAADLAHLTYEDPLAEARQGGQFVTADFSGKSDWLP